MDTILVIIILFIVFGGFGIYGNTAASWGPYSWSPLGVLVVILLLLWATGRL